jgi:hypothetical protein
MQHAASKVTALAGSVAPCAPMIEEDKRENYEHQRFEEAED